MSAESANPPRRRRRPPSWPLGSRFLGGFEGASLRTADGGWLDLVVATQHDVQAREDYARCRALGIRAVRETARWPLIVQQVSAPAP